MDSHPGTKTTTSIPIACTLAEEEARGQALEWDDLRARAGEITSVDGGVRMTFPSSMLDEVEDLARRERVCCAFLGIETSVRGHTLILEISTDDLEALPVIHAVAGITP